MTTLSSIEAEAARLVGRLSEARRRTLQASLANLCEEHWQELRGPQPDTPLARTLWAVAPPLADLCADLYAQRDVRLDDALQGRKPAQAFALLALLAIERGDAEGAHAAYAPMMLSQTAEAGARYAEGIAALLHGELKTPRLHRHEPTPPMTKALGLITAHTGRLDTPAILGVIGLLLSPDQKDEALERLRAGLLQAGVCLTGIDAGEVRFELHGHAHQPVSIRQLRELLAEIREARLG